MTQPPPEGPQYGAPGQPPPGQPPWSGDGRGSYPQQQLLPQQVKHGVDRSRLYVALAVAFGLVVVAGVAIFVLRDDGEDRRAEYCAELRDLTADGDVATALGNADPSVLDRIRKLPDTAPSAVADDWERLVTALETAVEQQQPDTSQLLGAFGALRAIAADARAECGLDLQIL